VDGVAGALVSHKPRPTSTMSAPVDDRCRRVRVVQRACGDDGADGVVARAWIEDAGELMVPDLVDVETVSVLRKRWLSDDITEARFVRPSTIWRASHSSAIPCLH